MENRWENWFEIIGLLAVVLSLIFVGTQMQQQRELTRASLAARGMEYYSRVAQILSDPEVAEAWVKMLEDPQHLSNRETIQVNSVLSVARDAFMRDCYLKVMRVFEECSYLLAAKAGEYFGSACAKAWRTNRPPKGYDVMQIMDFTIANLDDRESYRVFQAVRDTQ